MKDEGLDCNMDFRNGPKSFLIILRLTYYNSDCFPDYLNNLSPDSAEYEDTQGKIYIRQIFIEHDKIMSTLFYLDIGLSASTIWHFT